MSNAVNAPSSPAVDASAWPMPKLAEGDLQSYQSLNESIRLFEFISLKHYASANTIELRGVRAREISDELAKLKRELNGDGCPPGYIPDGNGHCIRNGAD